MQHPSPAWHLPSICFCSCGGAAASMEAVRGSCPWTWTAGWGEGRRESKARQKISNQNFSHGEGRIGQLVWSSKEMCIPTCCIVTCGWAVMCCWGLRTPAAYLYWGTPRTGAAAAAAAVAGRGPMVWAAVRGANRGRETSRQRHKQQPYSWTGFAVQLERLWIEYGWLTDTLGGHHAGHLGGRPHGTEGLRAWSWGTHRTRHVLEVYEHTKTERLHVQIFLFQS